MTSSLIDLDTQLFLIVNHFNTPMLDQFMKLVSHKMVWIPFYVVMFLFIIHRYGWRWGLTIAISAGVAIALSDQICATVIRPVVSRLRPANLDNPLSAMVHIVDNYRGGRYGFPSCHAANTFALAMFMSLVSRRRAIIATLYTWALINCWSRMYLGVHYPGDLIVGAMIGTMWGYAVFMAQRQLVRWWLHKSDDYSLPNRMRIASSALNSSFTLDSATATSGVVALTGIILMTFSIVAYLMS